MLVHKALDSLNHLPNPNENLCFGSTFLIRVYIPKVLDISIPVVTVLIVSQEKAILVKEC